MKELFLRVTPFYLERPFLLDKIKFYGIYGSYRNCGNFNNINMLRINRRGNKVNRMISAKDIIDKYRISYQTVNHYTDFGLLPVLVKKGNVRYYNRGVVQKRLKKIKYLTEEGYSLRLIRKKLIGI